MLYFAIGESDEGMGTSTIQKNNGPDTQLENFQSSPAALNSDLLQSIMHNSAFSDLQVSSSTTCTLPTTWPLSMDLPKGHPNLLHPKKLKTVGSSLASKYLLSVFNSYPRMMREKNSLPPFIHPRHPENVHNYNSPGDCAPPELPEFLTICASLVHMYQTRSSVSIAYV
jgi:hypothetical protein